MKQVFTLSFTMLLLGLPLAMAQKKPAPQRTPPSLKDADDALAKAAVVNEESVKAVEEAQTANPELPEKMATARKEAAASLTVAANISAKVAPPPMAVPAPDAPDYVQTSADSGDKKKDKMRVTAGASFFDSGKNEGVFTGKVVVDDPTMHIECEQLNVKLEDKDDKTAAPAAPAVPKSANAPEGEEEEARIETAIATGPKVYIRKPPTPKGKVQYGYCQKATYIGATKDILMERWAVVYDGPNIVRATAVTTTILLKENGEFKVNGPNQVDIAKESTTGLRNTSPGSSNR